MKVAGTLSQLLPSTLLLLFLFAACQQRDDVGEQAAAGTPDADSLVVGDSLITPESVLYDVEADVYLVSNINGSPVGTDDNGFISRISPAGELLEARWIDGADENIELHAPKGMAVRGDTLYVTDITAVRLFDRTTGAPLGSWEVAGSAFLNDPAVGADGSLFVTDTGMRFTETGAEPTGTDALYQLGADGAVVATTTEGLLRPNGVVPSASGGMIVVGMGNTSVVEVTSDGTVNEVAQLPTGGLDGIVVTEDGRYIITSWEGQALYRLDPGTGTIDTLFTGIASPADLGYDTQRRRVLIPQLREDKLLVLKVE